METKTSVVKSETKYREKESDSDNDTNDDEDNAHDKYCWFWQDDQGGMHPYSAAVSARLKAAMHMYKDQERTKRIPFRVLNFMYQISWRKRIQINLHTNNRRPICRVRLGKDDLRRPTVSQDDLLSIRKRFLNDSSGQMPTMKQQGAKVLRIECIWNAQSRFVFERQRACMERPHSILMYHGTSSHDPYTVCASGLDTAFANPEGRCGACLYTTVAPMLAHKYAHRVSGSKNTFQLLVVNVLYDKMCHLKRGAEFSEFRKSGLDSICYELGKPSATCLAVPNGAQCDIRSTQYTKMRFSPDCKCCDANHSVWLTMWDNRGLIWQHDDLERELMCREAFEKVIQKGKL